MMHLLLMAALLSSEGVCLAPSHVLGLPQQLAFVCQPACQAATAPTRQPKAHFVLGWIQSVGQSLALYFTLSSAVSKETRKQLPLASQNCVDALQLPVCIALASVSIALACVSMQPSAEAYLSRCWTWLLCVPCSRWHSSSAALQAACLALVSCMIAFSHSYSRGV